MVFGNVNPRLSFRARSSILGSTKSTLKVIMRERLKFHLYKIQIVQDLHDSDVALRKTYMEVLLVNFILLLKWVIYSLVTNNTFTSEDMWINKNARNPRPILQEPLHKPDDTVWCAFSTCVSIQPYFFESQRGQTITVSLERHAEMINDFFRLRPQNSPYFHRNMWY